MTSHADRAREIVPEYIVKEIGIARSRYSVPNYLAIRVAVAAALADVEREAMEKCLEILNGYFSLCHCDEAWTSRDRHAPECTVEDMQDAVAEIRAAFAADEREARCTCPGLAGGDMMEPDSPPLTPLHIGAIGCPLTAKRKGAVLPAPRVGPKE